MIDTVFLVVSDHGISVHYSNASATKRAEYEVSFRGGRVDVYSFAIDDMHHILTVSEAIQEVAA